MSDDEEDEIMHEVSVPDNTYAVFCTYDKEDNTLQVYEGHFECSDVVSEIGTNMRVVLENIIEEAAKRLEEIKVGPLQQLEKVSKIEGNVIHANFSKRIH
jgi:flavodoxin|tara:strand:- start:474 stop:773 length:300 start_codon:yes stop_codon:yes gene_type:complete